MRPELPPRSAPPARPGLPKSPAITVGYVGCLLACLAAPAQAQRLRHEFVPTEVLRLPVSRGGDAVEGEGTLPSAIKRDGERIEAPGEPDPEAPTARAPDDPQARQPDSLFRPREARPDRNTTQDHPLTYHALYNPEVAPLRRNVAFNRVESDYRMTIRPGALYDAPRGPRRPTPGREMFWGNIKVTTGKGPAPLPSVAPDMRILAAEVEPAVAVRFSKDAADNYYIESPHDGDIRVKFLVDADQAYFSAPLPGNVPLAAQAGHPDTELPPAIAAEGRDVLTFLGISDELPFDQGVDRLVAWFRDFEAAAPSEAKGTIYQDLALGQKGVCRHRSFAFLITARAAGVPTRAVQNEAHAFVEVLAPDGHWRRVDLGGQAPSLDLKGGADQRLHRPPPDPFAKPRKYLSQYSSQVVNGPTDQPGAEITGQPPPIGGGVPAPDQRPGEPGEGPGQGPGGEAAGPPDGPPAEVPLVSEPDEFTGEFPEATEPPLEAPAPKAVRVALDLAAGTREAWRGEPLPFPVTGRLTDAEGAPVGQLRVQIYAIPESGGPPRPLGPAVTAGLDGRFVATLRLPAALPLGPWRLVAASAAGNGFGPGRSDAP